MKHYLLILILFCAVLSVAGQKPTPTPKTVDPNLARWKITLDALEQQSRSIGPAARRPYFIADIAAAYWEIDKAEAQTQLNAGLDAAWKAVQEDKKQRPALDYVLSTAARLDPALVRSLNERLVKKEGAEKEANNIQGRTFYELLEQDPERAAQLLEAYAPNGLEGGSATTFIIQLAHKDINLANRVYKSYLTKILTNESISIEAILPLAGYAFGYAEGWTMDRRGYGPGASLQVVPGLAANNDNIALFLTAAYRRLAVAIEQRNNAPGTDTDSLNYTILFAFGYLLPEIEKFAPASLNAWGQLQKEGKATTTAVQTQMVAAFLNVIIPHRAKMQSFNASPEQQEVDAEASLENVEKTVGTCERDVVYTKAALVFNYRKKFKRALELLANIKGEKQNEIVTQVIATGMASDLIGKGEFEDAEKQIKKVTAYGPKAILNAELASKSIAQNDAALAERMIDETVTLTEKLADAKQRSGLLFALASIRLRSNPIEARVLLEKAIKDLNKHEAADVFRFSIPVRVPSGCGADPPMYWGDLDLPNATVLTAVKLFAEENPDATGTVVGSISDKPLKVRAEAIVAKAALAKLKRTTSNSAVLR